MSDLTRRRFLSRGSFALAGALAVVPVVAGAVKLTGAAPIPGDTSVPLIVHVRDVASGEISMLVGTEQVIVRDHALALRLYAAARPSR
jgi:hypothetical protein